LGFWSQIRKHFPDLSDNPPLPLVVEAPSQGSAVNVTPPFQMLNMPPLRRAVLKSGDGRHIIQIQQDKFILNWTRGKSKTYPDFETALSEFESHLSLLNKTLQAEGFGETVEAQYELMYVNLIGPDNGLALVGEGGLLVDHARDSRSNRFLPIPSGFNWTSSYDLPNEFGRLHVSAQPVLVPPENQRRVRLDMVARGFPRNDAGADRKVWFHLAHDWIVRGFADSTSPTLQKEVGKDYHDWALY
jgi:uncharacterized protein (TIGR04255 family)